MSGARLADMARVVPWADWDEWRRLRDDARGDAAARKRAAYMLAGWRLRRAAGMPVAIEADVALRALGARPRTEWGYEWRLAVGMAIVRLVNGLTDQLQPKAAMSTARSVRSLADTMKLPPALVAIRHQATHNNLPSADTLHDALQMAVQWIDSQYWIPQDERAKSQVWAPTPTSVVDLADVFEGVTVGAETPQSLPQGSYQSDGTVDVLQKMHQAIPRLRQAIAVKKQQQLLQDKLPRKRWRRCDNERAWKFTPLGLCPWQMQVDSLHHYADAEDEVNEEVLNGSQGASLPNGNDDDVVVVKKKRRLTQAEIEYVQRRRKQLLA